MQQPQTTIMSRGPRAPGLTGTPQTQSDACPAPEAAPSSDPQAATPSSGCPIHRLLKAEGPDGRPLAPMARAGVLVMGLAAYVLFFGTFLYAIGFVSNLVVPKSIDTGVQGPLIPSLLINGVLLTLFVVQHTVMARPAFKRWWTRILPEPMERSIFVAAASACLLLVFWQWRPLTGVIWSVDQPILRGVLTGIALLGWGIVLASSFMINHFDLFGLRQTWHGVRGTRRPAVPFVLTGFYRFVRHPLMVGFLIAFWVTPTMTVGHLFFAVMTTLYIFVGTWIEERDLVAALGDTYRQYRRQVRAFVPLPRRRGATAGMMEAVTEGASPVGVPATASLRRSI